MFAMLAARGAPVCASRRIGAPAGSAPRLAPLARATGCVGCTGCARCMIYRGSPRASAARVATSVRPSPLARTVLQPKRSLAGRVHASSKEELQAEVLDFLGKPDDRIPVTIITGFLGSGKTTLLNRILKDDHGLRIAVIENEFGEIDIDGSLVAQQLNAEENIMMLNNGCLCCTVRGDLVNMLNDLATNKADLFDHVLIETTGLANPAPIIQTFFLEDSLADKFRLDGVVTVVDAKHISQHLDEEKPDGAVNEAMEQVAFADRLILNKTDLVEPAALDRLQERIKGINQMADVVRAQYAEVSTKYVMGVGGFALESVVEAVDTQLGVGQKKKEEDCGHEHGECNDPTHDHSHAHSHGAAEASCEHEHGGECNDPSHDHSHGAEAHGHDHSHGAKEDCGHEHGECNDPTHDHSHGHTHDDAVTSISLVENGDLNLDKVNLWLGLLLEVHQENIYRMKGVLAIEGAEERFVFQGVHALFEGSPEKPWGDEPRVSRMVFIGKDLPKDGIRESFKECLVGHKTPVEVEVVSE